MYCQLCYGQIRQCVEITNYNSEKSLLFHKTNSPFIPTLETEIIFHLCIPKKLIKKYPCLHRPVDWSKYFSSEYVLYTNKLVCGGRSGAIWLPSHHPDGCCTLVVVEEIPRFYVKRFEYPEKHYINVTISPISNKKLEVDTIYGHTFLYKKNIFKQFNVVELCQLLFRAFINYVKEILPKEKYNKIFWLHNDSWWKKYTD